MRSQPRSPEAPALTVRLTKATNAQHRFEYERRDGTGESLLLDTRSFLAHDLLHFAVETEAGLRQSFYGGLAHAMTYATAAPPDDDLSGEAGLTEMVVGGFTSLIKGEAGPKAVVAGITHWMQAQDREPPSWLTVDFAIRVRERFRRLMGEWKATPSGGTMTLRYPPET